MAGATFAPCNRCPPAPFERRGPFPSGVTCFLIGVLRSFGAYMIFFGFRFLQSTQFATSALARILQMAQWLPAPAPSFSAAQWPYVVQRAYTLTVMNACSTCTGCHALKSLCLVVCEITSALDTFRVLWCWWPFSMLQSSASSPIHLSLASFVQRVVCNCPCMPVHRVQ